MSKLYGIREFCKLASVTIRTLHYYEQIGLFKPHHKTETKYRFYSEDSLLQLQHINTLKFMGFSLSQIANIIKNPTENLKDTFLQQSKMLTEKGEGILKAAKLLENLATQVEVNNSIDWSIVTKIASIMQTDKTCRQQWYEKYLTSTELNKLRQISQKHSSQYWKEYNKRWADLFKEIKVELHTDPEGETGLKLAEKWLQLVDEVYDRNDPLRNKLWEAYKAGIIPQNELPHNQNIINYMSKATKKFKEFLKRSIEASKQANTAIHELDELLETGFSGNEVKHVDKASTLYPPK